MVLSGEVYVCSDGETWDSVALTVYGDEKHASEILSVNPALCSTPIFHGGEVLSLPVIAVPNEDGAEYQSAEAPWRE